MKSFTLPSTLPTLEPTHNPASLSVESVSAIEETQKQNPKTASKVRQQGFWGVFISTFLTIFLAEMGDKTQLATLLMSAESQSPWIVFAGAGTALVATSLVGVLLGRWLAKCFSPKTLEASAATVLMFISVLLLWDVVNF